jgi:branched-chain amino acid transport system substrate-binding protein
MNDATREWSQRFNERVGQMPTMVQAGVYSAVTHYLNAIQATGSDQAKAVVDQMKATPVNDFFAANGTIREDGRMVHDMYLARVKTPDESTGQWDYYEILRTIPGDQAFLPIEKSACALVTQ